MDVKAKELAYDVKALVLVRRARGRAIKSEGVNTDVEKMISVQVIVNWVYILGEVRE